MNTENQSGAAPFDPVNRVHDDVFNAEIEKLVRYSEDLRVSKMQTHQTRKMASTTVFILSVMVGALGFGWYLFMEGRIDIAVMCIIASIALPFSLHLWAQAPLEEYKEDYKRKFLPKLAHVLGGFKFHTNRGVSHKVLNKTGVLPQHDIYKAEDCFIGHYKGIKVLFSESRLYLQKHKTPVFDGIFVLLEAPEAVFNGHTIITSDYVMAQKYAHRRWKSLQKVTMPHLTANSVDFEVFSSSAEDAKTLTSDALLKELAEASQIFNKAPITCVLFAKRFMFLMISDTHDMFEASDLFIPVKTQRHAQNCKAEIDKILEIVDIFDVFKQQANDHESQENTENH